MTPRALLLDLGDTLVFRAHEPDDDGLYRRMAEQVRPLLQAWNAAGTIDAVALLRDLYRAVETAQPERRAQGYEVDGPFIAQGALAEYGLDVSPEQAAELWRASAVDLSVWGWQLYPDTIDTLRRVRSLALPMGVVSNNWCTSDVTRRLVAPLGIPDDLLGVLVTSALMRPKPHPAPFERALELLGVDAGAAAVVGDDLEADVARRRWARRRCGS
jgi:FMN phosphatase YigB (HAD superfamily)